MKERIARGLEKIGDLLGCVSAAIIMLLAIPVVYDAVARDVGHPTTWGFEVTLYALITGAFLANAQALKHGNHFRVRFLISLFPQAGKYLDTLAWVATLAFGAIVAVSGAMFAAYSYANDIHAPTLLATPLYIPQAMIPLGGLALTLQSAAHLLSGASGTAEQSE